MAYFDGVDGLYRVERATRLVDAGTGRPVNLEVGLVGRVFRVVRSEFTVESGVQVRPPRFGSGDAPDQLVVLTEVTTHFVTEGSE